MKRLLSLAVIGCGLWVVVGQATKDEGLPATTWGVANEFADAYKDWAHMRNERHQEGTLSYVEFAAWRRVKAAWRALEARVDREFRGERVQ